MADDKMLDAILTELVAIHDLLEKQLGHFHEDVPGCARCREDRELRALQREAVQRTIKHLDDEDGFDNWGTP